MNEKHQIRFTQRGLKSLALIVADNPNHYEHLYHYLFTDLCYYPLQGRLLLNRDSKDKEIKQLTGQLAERFNNMEIREVYYHCWLIIYLNHKSSVYLLDLISLQNTFTDAAPIWNQEF